MMHVEPVRLADGEKAPAYFKDALEDAERLLKYAAEAGIDIDPDTRSAVLHARATLQDGWTEEVAAKLLQALTTLAGRVKPVSAASLKVYQPETRPTMHLYLVWAIILAAFIIPVSIATFVSSNIAEAIRGDIAKANTLSVKLKTELSQPAATDFGISEKHTDLMEYAATVRLIYARADRLNWFLFIDPVEVPAPLKSAEEEKLASKKEKDLTPSEKLAIAKEQKEKFELDVPLPDDDAGLQNARTKITITYQDVRYFAQTITTDISTFYGAVNGCVLPILYALLGTCAYLLRTFEDQMSNRSFIPSAANSARFLIAAIAGTVIGLFGNFSQQASVSPLAIAFLVGYSVEVFFSFLEGLIKAFTKSASAPAAVPTAKAEGRA